MLAQAFAVWVVGQLDRIEPTTPPGTQAAATAEAGRNEIASAQLAVQAPTGGLHGLGLAIPPLKGPHGATLIPVLFRENFIHLAHHSPIQKPNVPLSANAFPDALIPFIDPATGNPPLPATYRPQPIDLAAGTDAAYWIDIPIPAGTAPGTYRASYTVTAQEGSATGTLTVTVLPFTAPLQPTLRTSLNSDTQDPPGESEELLRNRISPNRVPPAQQARDIATYGLAAADLGFYSGANISHCTMTPPPTVAAIAAAKAQQDSRLYLYDFSADEITKCRTLFPRVRAWARALHAAGVPNLVTMAPVPALLDDGSGTGRSAVDIWTVLPVEYVRAQAQTPPRITQVLNKGDSVWFYTALVQDGYSPKWEIDFAPIDFRVSTGFLNAAQGLTGTLYWSVDYWTKSPWTNPEYTDCSSGTCYYFPGEGALVYPGRDAGLQGVAGSLRLKYIRDGIQDYERYAILARCGHATDALAAIRPAAIDYKHWTQDPATLLNASASLAKLIVQYGCS